MSWACHIISYIQSTSYSFSIPARRQAVKQAFFFPTMIGFCPKKEAKERRNISCKGVEKEKKRNKHHPSCRSAHARTHASSGSSLVDKSVLYCFVSDAWAPCFSFVLLLALSFGGITAQTTWPFFLFVDLSHCRAT